MARTTRITISINQMKHLARREARYNVTLVSDISKKEGFSGHRHVYAKFKTAKDLIHQLEIPGKNRAPH